MDEHSDEAGSFELGPLQGRARGSRLTEKPVNHMEGYDAAARSFGAVSASLDAFAHARILDAGLMTTQQG